MGLILVVNALNRRACPVFIILSILSLVTFGHIFSMPVHAAATPVLSISPSNRPLAAPGSTVTYNVSVSNISPGDALAGWEIYVRTNSSVLNPMDFTIPSSLGAGFDTAHCVNDVGTGCTIDDTILGTVHSAFALFGNPVSGNLTLLTITYTAVAGPDSLVAYLSPGVKTQLFDPSGIMISFTAANGSYGSVPILPVASFTWTPLHPFAGDYVTFGASSSYDPSGRLLVLYSWDFAPINGFVPPIEASGLIVKEIFSPGNWTATLTVKNDLGVSSYSTFHVFYVALKVSRDLAVSIISNSFPFPGILPGSTQTIFVLVKNVGTTTETRFNVSLSVPGQIFLLPPYPSPLFPNSDLVFKFTWNTTGVQPGTYTIHAHLDPLVNETNIANNDDFLSVTFVPYLLFTPNPNIPIILTEAHHGQTTNVTLESGSGFAGTITLSASSIGPGSPSRLSIKFDRSSIAMAPNSFVSTTIRFAFDKKTAPGDYLVAVFATSGSFKVSGIFFVRVP